MPAFVTVQAAALGADPKRLLAVEVKRIDRVLGKPFPRRQIGERPSLPVTQPAVGPDPHIALAVLTERQHGVAGQAVGRGIGCESVLA